MSDPIITPTERDGCSAPARTLNARLQQLVGTRYSPLPNQQGLAVLDRQGRRIGTLYFEEPTPTHAKPVGNASTGREG